MNILSTEIVHVKVTQCLVSALAPVVDMYCLQLCAKTTLKLGLRTALTGAVCC